MLFIHLLYFLLHSMKEFKIISYNNFGIKLDNKVFKCNNKKEI